MNPESHSRDDLLAASIATPWLALVGALALALWLLSLRGRRGLTSRGARIAAGAGGTLLCGAALWLAFQSAARGLALATSWPLWVVALIGGLGAEAVIGIYRLERGLVASAWRGRCLLGLRLAALAVLLAILLQPARSFLVQREISREVAVLLDDSLSMRISDQRLGPGEMLDRAAWLGVAEAVDARPPLAALGRGLAAARSRLSAEQAALAGSADLAALLESRHAPLGEALDEAEATREELAAAWETLGRDQELSAELRQAITEERERFSGPLDRALKEIRASLAAEGAEELPGRLAAAVEQLDETAARLPALREAVDQRVLERLPEEARAAVAEAAARPRVEIARALLENPVPGDAARQGQAAGQTLLDQLGERYNLRFYRFARDPGESAGPGSGDWESGPDPEDVSGGLSSTDLTAALEQVLDRSSPESLAGVLLLSDGRHNGPRVPEDALRQLGVQNSPINAVPIGGRLGPVDASLLSLSAPESIYLGDRVGVRAEAKFSGLRGQEIKAVLRQGGLPVEEQTVAVSDIDQRVELRFAHFPEAKGIYDYELELEPVDSELFEENNRWEFKVAVTDDRTNVLLVDGYPRWEFRYLRNLFYGRDKSVHLQYVLLNPDRIEGARGIEGVAASAARPFGEAEATALPRDAEEWKLFDVIILGDIPPGAVGRADWDAISDAVTRRGALLVCVGGPRYMPRAHESQALADLLPVTWEPSVEPAFAGPEPSFRLALTAAGRTHPVMAQSTSRSLNAQLWAQMPAASWRLPPLAVKEGAEVLAYAEADGAGAGSGAAPALDGSPESVERAIEQLANRKRHEEERALVTVQRAGLGKVAMLSFDQTWRLRYGAGDTYHHRFWGQLVRWGAGENLRSGGQRVRLGTDRLTYTPSDPVEITAKLLDADRRPVTGADLTAIIHQPGQPLVRQRMSYRTGSSGIYETTVAALPAPGEYVVRLEGREVEAALAAEEPGGPQSVETEIAVVPSRNPVELAELTADRDFLGHAAQASGGRLFEIGDAAALADAFGAPRETLTERRNITLWDKWPVLAAFLALLTSEWILRRRSGLA